MNQNNQCKFITTKLTLVSNGCYYEDVKFRCLIMIIKTNWKGFVLIA